MLPQNSTSVLNLIDLDEFATQVTSSSNAVEMIAKMLMVAKAKRLKCWVDVTSDINWHLQSDEDFRQMRQDGRIASYSSNSGHRVFVTSGDIKSYMKSQGPALWELSVKFRNAASSLYQALSLISDDPDQIIIELMIVKDYHPLVIRGLMAAHEDLRLLLANDGIWRSLWNADPELRRVGIPVVSSFRNLYLELKLRMLESAGKPTARTITSSDNMLTLISMYDLISGDILESPETGTLELLTDGPEGIDLMLWDMRSSRRPNELLDRQFPYLIALFGYEYFLRT